ncbi:MAG: TonB-dependent receptor [Caulobacter sp. 32-67-35]|nr:MAG: TonB-dependent receptor [Caulobacter sp. 32-67-35]
MVRLSLDLLVGASALVLASTVSLAAQAAEPPVRSVVSVKAGALDRALLSLATQTKVRILFGSDLVAGRSAPSLSGRFTAAEALARLLAGSDIEVRQTQPGVLILRPRRVPAAYVPPSGDMILAGAGAVGQTAIQSDPAAPAPNGASDETVILSEVVVGSHIRGGRNGASPVLVVGREDMDRAGYATVADALTALPQVFTGSASDDAGAANTDPTTTNGTRATGVNLRGLGADATLVLINGRRMAGAGLMADFADVSAIPMAAVERVEILLDGASAVYGSDAVGGVVNIVMRERYDGAETRMRVGGSTHGDLGQRQIGQTFGRAWASGSLLLSGEYQRRDRLRATARDYTGEADLRPYGGTDHRFNFSQPGNIMGIDPISKLLVPVYAIPAGQSGVGLKPSDFIAGTRNYQNWRAVADILPTQERGSLYLAATQDVGEHVTLNADVRYSDRRYTVFTLAPQTILTVGRNNPFFVSPTGAATHQIGYSLQNETGGLKNAGESQSRGLSFGAKVRLPADWRLDAYVLHAEEIGTNRATRQLNSAYLNEALGNLLDNPLTAFSAARDGYFNPFIGQGRNTQTVLDFVTSGYDTRRTVGRLDTVSLTADGALWRLPAGAVRLALGGQARTEHLKTIGQGFTSAVTPTVSFSRRGDRTITGLFAEARVPVFGDGFRRPGFERLELSAAVRREHYENGATSTVPKLGLVWSPVADLTAKATYGESFIAPSLGELNDPGRVSPVNVSNGSRTILTLIRYGGNKDLRPETAKSWTAGLDYAPAAYPTLRLSGTLFRTAFKNRIGQPANDNPATVLTAPDLAPFRTFISPTTNPADLALVQELLLGATAATAALYPATAYGAIADARYTNTGTFTVRGLDLNGTYGLKIGDDPLTLSGNLSWLMSYRRKISASAQAVELAGMTEYPADLRGRVSAAWTHGSLTTTASLNHVGDLHAASGQRLKAMTTADLQLQYAPRVQSGPWHGVALALSVQNLFDQDPPFYDNRVGVAYDPANYDPFGRVVALQLTKAW